MQADSGFDFLPARAVDWIAGKLVNAWPALSPHTTCGETYEWFLARPDQPAAAIVDEAGRAVGLINRLRFFTRYAQRYYPELFARQPILKLANTQPLIVDEKLPIAEVGARLLTEQPEALVECFIVTSHGRYLGVGTGEALMRSKVELLIAHQTHLSRALFSLNQANQAKSSFLALMSHELRTPLNAIIGFSEVLGTEMFGPLGAPRYREYAGDIHSAGHHLLALINDILDISKAEAGKMELHLETIDAADLVGECVRLMRDRAEARRLHLFSTLGVNLPKLRVDRLRVKQILPNLLSNAVKFTPEQGRIECSVWPSEAGGFSLAVRDTGIGMAPEMIPVATQPFRQIQSTYARDAEGTGLGLPLVRMLAELHGGSVEIESALGKGTTVRVHFPSACAVISGVSAAQRA